MAKSRKGSTGYDVYAAHTPAEIDSIISLGTCWAWETTEGDERRGSKTRECARRRYQDVVKGRFSKPDVDALQTLLLGTSPRAGLEGWFALEVDFQLDRPWFSKDTAPLHCFDNPVRKDRVFGIPLMAAASWKGLLRWACRMQAGLGQHLREHHNSMQGWKDPGWIVHLFGNTRGEETVFTRGALAFRPTWFNGIGFELINPHTRYGKGQSGGRPPRPKVTPIPFEVVPKGAKGTLNLLYAPTQAHPVSTESTTFQRLFCAIEDLLTVYGFSAKRSSGWGRAQIKSWKISGVGGLHESQAARECLERLQEVRCPGGGR